jgi:hypothetical protein
MVRLEHGRAGCRDGNIDPATSSEVHMRLTRSIEGGQHLPCQARDSCLLSWATVTSHWVVLSPDLGKSRNRGLESWGWRTTGTCTTGEHCESGYTNTNLGNG